MSAGKIRKAQNANEETKRGKQSEIQIKCTAKLNEVNKGCQLWTNGLGDPGHGHWIYRGVGGGM